MTLRISRRGQGFTRKLAILLQLMATTTLLAACMDQPRNGQAVTSRSERVYFHGYTPWKDEVVQVKAYNDRRKVWELLTQTRTGTQPYTDNSGTVWYVWAVYANLPKDNSYWDINGGFNTIRVKSYSHNADLNTFNTNADACMEAAGEVGGIEIINKCKAGLEAQLRLPCGAAGQLCCDQHDLVAGQQCQAGLLCSSGKCVQCGGAGELCCGGNTCDNAGLLCPAGRCTTCGGAGEFCCAGDKCDNSDLTCSTSSTGARLCADCGQRGEACCSFGCLTSDLQCSSGSCQDKPTDLYVKFITSPDGLSANITVENGGPSTARGGFGVRLQSDIGADVILRCNDDLPPGQICALNGVALRADTFQTVRACSAQATVDVHDEIAESDETNNVRAQSWHHISTFTWCAGRINPFPPF